MNGAHSDSVEASDGCPADGADRDFREWVGRTESCSDVPGPGPLTALAATLDRPHRSFGDGDIVPALWHWLYFLNPVRGAELGAEGHPRRGQFLPPIPLPRRMWAGSRFRFERSLQVGEAAERRSTIKNISFKQGRSGRLAFVQVGHHIIGERGAAFHEEQDIVYRAPATASPAAPDADRRTGEALAPRRSDYHMTVEPDPVLLFRYSALTFNAHRIHYDRDYVTGVEGYPGLIVHGPLLATLLLELLDRHWPNRTLRSFRFTALKPVFDLAPFQVCGRHPDARGVAQLWIQDAAGCLCMEAEAGLDADPA